MSENIQDAEFEEVKNNVEEQSNFGYNSLGMVDNTSDDDEEESGSIESLTKISDEYKKSEIEETKMFLNPETGEMVERSKLPPLEQIRVTAKSTGHHINNPKKSCKKCHGRGYTGIKLEGTPIACDCIFEEYYKANPESKKKDQQYSGPTNRKQKRYYEKQYRSYMMELIKKEMKNQEIIEKSKKNLRKNTPEVTIIETAEGVI